MELARVESAHVPAIELGELGEKHGVDGDVDAHAQRVGTADYGQEALLRELLHQQAVARQHTGVVHAHAREDEPLQGLAKRSGEAHALDGVLQGLALLLRRDAVAREGLRALEGSLLREVHNVERRVAVTQGQLDRALERSLHELVGEGYRPGGVEHLVDGASGVLLECGGNVGDVAQRGGHEQELRVGQRQQRHLPGPAAVAVAVEVELVHGHATDVCVLAKAQRVLGKDLGCAADHGSLAVYHHVTGDHAHVVFAEKVNQVEELLADQRLYGRRVVGAAVGAVGYEEHAHGNHALA